MFDRLLSEYRTTEHTFTFAFSITNVLPGRSLLVLADYILYLVRTCNVPNKSINRLFQRWGHQTISFRSPSSENFPFFCLEGVNCLNTKSFFIMVSLCFFLDGFQENQVATSHANLKCLSHSSSANIGFPRVVKLQTLYFLRRMSVYLGMQLSRDIGL